MKGLIRRAAPADHGNTSVGSLAHLARLGPYWREMKRREDAMEWDRTGRRPADGHTIALAMACLFFAEKTNTEIGEFIDRLETVLNSDLVDGKPKWDSQATEDLLMMLQRLSRALRTQDSPTPRDARYYAPRNSPARRAARG